MRFETLPGLQSRIDWGQARVPFRHQTVVAHVFVLTLGLSRHAFYEPGPDERLGSFLETHERAFEHFGGHNREPRYDRPRTVCQPGPEGRVLWNAACQAFAASWGVEARLCRPYRAQTPGKVASGVTYGKRHVLPGRTFVDWLDLHEQQAEWRAEIADVRVHGTTHERLLDRFQREQPYLRPTAGQPSSRLEAPQPGSSPRSRSSRWAPIATRSPSPLSAPMVEVCRAPK